MRRNDKAMTDVNDIFSVIERCHIVHIAMVENGKPYLVAMNFGYERRGSELILYLHSAQEGRKMDALKKNPEVYFQMEHSAGLAAGTQGKPCSYSWHFDSVMGSGQVLFLTDEAEQTHALNRIVQHLVQTEETFDFPPQMLNRTCIWKIVSTDFTGKSS